MSCQLSISAFTTGKKMIRLVCWNKRTGTLARWITAYGEPRPTSAWPARIAWIASSSPLKKVSS